MENELEFIQKKFNELYANIFRIHQEHSNWFDALNKRQMRLERIMGVSDKAISFSPYYPNLDISPACPEIYNKYGERMEVFFISDREFNHVPNSINSRYIYWDRYNYGLETHFYTQDEIFHTVGKPKRKFAALFEPPSIKPASYENVLRNKDYIEKNFDAIFTYDARILSAVKNAKFAPLAADVWYGKNLDGIMHDGSDAGFSVDGKPKENLANPAENYKHKTKDISIVASQKKFTPMHAVRHKFAFKCKELPNVDTYGKFDGGNFVPMEVPLKEYRYSIVIENLVSPFYFSEKICNCLAAQTIPIYIGATEIGRFFNPNGIIPIRVEDFDRLEEILSKCTPEEYERRLPAVIDNFNRVQPLADHTRWDDIYVNYLKPKN